MEARRSIAARLGIALLNLLMVGLGLVRLGKWHVAIAVYLVSMFAIWFIVRGPLSPFPVLAAVGLTSLLMVLLSIGLTWAWSSKKTRTPIYGRWFGLIGIFLINYVAMFLIFPDFDRRHYRSFYLPSESMMPTLPKLDRIFGYMVRPDNFRRGDLALIRQRDGTTYVKRIVGLPGDRIAMQSGVIVLNGLIVPQLPVDSVMKMGPEPARVFREHFPTEAGSHEIMDLGLGPLDDFAEMLIEPNRVFVLGDNRDRSADSRVSPDEGGTGQVAFSDIVGIPLYYSWGSSRALGTKIR